MQIQEILQNYIIQKKENTPRSERAELISKFEKRLNPPRIEAGMKPLSAGFISMKMAQSKLSTQDLYWFYRYCDDAKNFSSCWWWSLKAK